MEWIVPVTAFFLVSSLYLSHESLEYQGGRGVQHLLGLGLYAALFMGLFAILHGALGDLVGTALSTVISTLLVILAMPALAWVAFRVTGVRIRKVGRLLRGREGAAH